MKEETSGGHKDCAVPERGYCLIGGSSSKSIRGPPQSCRVWSVSRRSWKLGVFSPVMGKLRDISAVCVKISEWRAQKNMQPGSFQCCFTAEQEAVGSNSVKHRMFPVNRKHFFTLRDQAPVGGDCQVGKNTKCWCSSPPSHLHWSCVLKERLLYRAKFLLICYPINL